MDKPYVMSPNEEYVYKRYQRLKQQIAEKQREMKELEKIWEMFEKNGNKKRES